MNIAKLVVGTDWAPAALVRYTMIKRLIARN
jgi:hypothetical protein